MVLSIFLASFLFAQNGLVPQSTTAPASSSHPGGKLTSFLTALKASETTPVNVVIFGDSISRCYFLPCADTPTLQASLWVEQLRSYLSGKFGSHGTGIIPVQIGVFKDGAIDTENWTLTGLAVLDSTVGPSEDFTDVSSVYALRNNATATLAPKYGDTAHVYIRQNGSETAGGFEASVDGVRVGIFAATAASGATVISVPLGPLGKHSITVAPGPGGVLRLYGIEVTSGTHGVSVHNVSEGGCRVDCFGASPATQEAFTDIIPGGVQLAIIALGSNDAIGNVAASIYQTNLSALVTHEMGLGGSPSVIILNEPWMASISGSNQAPYFTAALAVAEATGAELYNPTTNFFKSFSNEQSKKWIGPSNVQLTDLGEQQYGKWVLEQMLGLPESGAGATEKRPDSHSK